MNNRGQIIGYSNTTATTTEHAFLYNYGRMQDLNNLRDRNSDWILSDATGIKIKKATTTGQGSI